MSILVVLVVVLVRILYFFRVVGHWINEILFIFKSDGR